MTMNLLTIRYSQLNTLVSQDVQECSVSKQPHHEKCAQISSIVTIVNRSGAVPPFRSSFETEEILADEFSSNFAGLSQKN